MKSYGLVGRKLSHSFSQGYFENRFRIQNITDCKYQLFELSAISELPELIKSHSDLVGFNVTIPYKKAILPYLDHLDESAEKVGAVNVVKVEEGRVLKGYNTDYQAFKKSLKNWIGEVMLQSALVLGTGGASKAVTAALNELEIAFRLVSRKPNTDELPYSDLIDDPKLFESNQLIINTTPLGMSPNVEGHPDIPYQLLNSTHYLYDLVYNPEITQFLTLGQAQGANIKNGLEMLHLQAELSWEIWNNS